jgi:hypothetical protein
VDKLQAVVAGHLPGKFPGGFEVVKVVNLANRFGFFVADIDKPCRDFDVLPGDWPLKYN